MEELSVSSVLSFSIWIVSVFSPPCACSAMKSRTHWHQTLTFRSLVTMVQRLLGAAFVDSPKPSTCCSPMLSSVLWTISVCLSEKLCDPPCLNRSGLHVPVTIPIFNKNTQRIEASLKALSEHMTVIVIAHVHSALRNAQHVIVLDHGTVVEQGAFQDLVEAKRLLVA